MSKKVLFIIYMIIAALAGISNFMEPANVFVMGALGLSLLVIVLGDEMATLYLMMALIPFYNSLNIGGIATDFIVQGAALIKLFMSRSRGIKPSLLMSFFIALFLLIWFIHDIQYKTLAASFFPLLVPLYTFSLINNKPFNRYDGYFAMWVIIVSTLIAMICVFMVQGGNIDAFLYTDYAGEIRLGEGSVDEGQKNQLGGAMGFPIYTLTIVTLLIQMLMTRKYKLWKKLSIIILIGVLFFITFLTVSRVYLLGLATMIVILALHLMRSRSTFAIVGFALTIIFIIGLASIYMSDYIDTVIFNYTGRIEGDGGQAGMGIRGLIYDDCLKYLSNNIECTLIGKGNGAYPLIGDAMGSLMSYSAHNIILDALMSFGILGSILLIIIYLKAYKIESLRLGIKWSLFRIMPFIVIFIMWQTGSPFLQDKTYIIIMFFMLNIIHCTDGTEYDTQWCRENDLQYKKI